ncbi:MAG: gamma-glutamyltransferase family protein [Rubrivivax sp.]|nr:gamma-glutamyltransferase family protein [Rubrivivax sp.]
MLAVVAAACVACAVAPAPGPAAPAAAKPPPEAASGWQAKPGWQFAHGAVAAAHPLAAEAGARVLRQGGNALDAAIAAQMVLSLVEPQSSGIGGGAFLLHWDGREVAAWDGRETAPAAADERLFLQPDGQPLPFAQAAASGLAVGVPGAVRMLEAAHRAHGRLPWAQLVEPAVALAERGFAVSPRLHAQLAAEATRRKLAADPQARAYFYESDGTPLPAGKLLRNPALAAVLRAIAARGSAALHEGPTAADLVARVRGHAVRPGRMTLQDLADYRPVRRSPMCTDWRLAWRVCGFPPPSSGFLTTMQILGLIEQVERRDAGALVPRGAALVAGVPGADWLHRYAEAARLAFADRDQYIADPAFTPAPGGHWASLLDRGYLLRRSALVGERSGGRHAVAPGQPGAQPVAFAPMPPQPEAGTSHISVVDAGGHAVALTTSIESAFGAGILADGGTGLPGGYLLNNQLTDFALAPADALGRPVANRVQPRKRPRSSMSPTLVFGAGDGQLAMTLGSPGGAAIIHYTAKVLVGTLQWGLDAQRAIDLPNFGAYNGSATLLEAGRFAPAVAAALRARGHEVSEVELTSGVQALQRLAGGTGGRIEGGWHGGADPRREGVVAGD